MEAARTLYLWRYLQNTRNYPGWHFAADEAVCRAFADLIQRMLDAQYNCQKALTITAPTKEILRIPNNQGGEARWSSPHTLIIKHQKDKTPDDYAALEDSAGTVTISAGRRSLDLLKVCVLKIIEGENDYAIEIGNTELWFW